MTWTVLPTGILVAIAAAVVALMFYKRSLAAHEDDLLHIRSVPAGVPDPSGLASRLDAVDRWGKTLMVALIVYGIALLAYWSYYISFVDVTRGLG